MRTSKERDTLIVPVALDDISETSEGRLVVAKWPNADDIHSRAYRYHQIEMGLPLFVSAGALRDRSGERGDSVNIILFPVKKSGEDEIDRDAIAGGLEEICRWIAFMGGKMYGKILVPKMTEDDFSWHAYNSVVGGIDQFVWVGEDYELQ